MTANPATIAGCEALAVRSWLTGLIVTGIVAIIVECQNMGSDFNGHKFVVECTAAQYIIYHPPPNGVPANVRSFYKKQCSDECTDPRNGSAIQHKSNNLQHKNSKLEDKNRRLKGENKALKNEKSKPEKAIYKHVNKTLDLEKLEDKNRKLQDKIFDLEPTPKKNTIFSCNNCSSNISSTSSKRRQLSFPLY
ncbi:hypothetical protein BGZ74_002165 [Mortierella antarctica]|nr:hypothetical protein BGZ74_002165 [Mortierella antarctica]